MRIGCRLAALADGLGGASWWKVVWLINTMFLLATLHVGSEWPGEFFLRPLHLGNEMNLGSWWSGMQLLMFGLLAHSLSRMLAERDRKGSRAFMILGLIGLALYCDEIGSIHERADCIIPLPGDAALVPFAFLGAVALSYALVTLYHRRDDYVCSWWLVPAAFAVFGAVYVQEFAEQRVDWPAWSEGLRVVAIIGTKIITWNPRLMTEDHPPVPTPQSVRPAPATL